MTGLLANIKNRRSIRSYKPDPVPQELLDQIIEAGLYAPSAMGRQNTLILQITDTALRDSLAKLNCQAVGWSEDKDPFYGAPAVLVVLAKKDSRTRVYDGSLVLGNLLLAAHQLGLGSCWIHRAKEEFETDWGKNLLKTLGIEGEYEGIGHCILGYAEGEAPAASARNQGRVFALK